MKTKLFLCLTVLTLNVTACSYDSDYNRPEKCDHLNYKTFCDENILVSCGVDDKLVEVFCSDGCDQENLQCSGQDACDGVDSNGVCEDNVAKKCVNGELKTQICQEGTKCGTRSDGQIDCIENDVPSYTVGKKCPDDITYDGICDGNIVVFCNDGIVAAEDCGSSKCMIKEAYTEPFAECFIECGDVDYVGICNKDGYDYCNSNEGLIHITCENGKSCQMTKDNLYSCI